MEKLFLTVLNMSVTASAVIIVVLLARLALWDAPKVFSYALWAVVLFRLLCPFTIESNFALISGYLDLQFASLFDQQEVSRPEAVTGTSGASTDDELPVEPISSQGQETAPISVTPRWTLIASSLWLAGIAALLGHSIWSMMKLRRRLVGSIQMEGENNVRLADHIPSPFVLGLLSPKIYLPSDLSKSEQDYILLHERTHIRRMDHISRALAWLALAVHWFNPLVWLAFYLAGKDMEMSCDETVLRKMDRDIRTEYSTSLLRLSVGGNLTVGPLAFGGGDLKRRIKNILNYKKPALWVPILAFVVVLTTGTALATDPNRLTKLSDVTSVTVSSKSFEANREDILGTTNNFTLSKEDGAELVRLINSCRKSVYRQGDNKSNPLIDDWMRINCTDGGFYVLHYWYWNSFSLNPFHMGEDDYTTLVTYYDAAGNAGTTWQMEYNFDRAFRDWRAQAVFPLRSGT